MNRLLHTVCAQGGGGGGFSTPGGGGGGSLDKISILKIIMTLTSNLQLYRVRNVDIIYDHEA